MLKHKEPIAEGLHPMTSRILLVEDDATTAEFMRATLEDLPATVLLARSRAQALAQEGPFDLCLVDANLPDGRGEELLQRLRERQPDVPALAHTADHGQDTQARLCAAGFAAVVAKPVRADVLRQAARDALAARPPVPVVEVRVCGNDLPAWDDTAALTALGGNPAHLDTLRGLFLQELDSQVVQIQYALDAADVATAHQLLHRLKASTGLVGAMRLRAATEALDAALPDLSSRGEFVAAWQASRAQD